MIRRHRCNLAISDACLNHCGYCGGSTCGSAIPAAGPDDWKKIAKEVIEAGFQEVVLGGGEPLLSGALPELVSILAPACDVALFTGGIPSGASTLLEAIDRGLSRVVFSLDGPDEASNDRLRGRAGATRDLLDMAEAVRSRHPRFGISFNTVVSRLNHDMLDGIWTRVRPLSPETWSLVLVGDFFDGTADRFLLDEGSLGRYHFQTLPRLAGLTQQDDTILVALPVPLPFLQRDIPIAEWGHSDFVDDPEIANEIRRYSRGEYNATYVERYGCHLVGIDTVVGPGGEAYPCSQAGIMKPEFVIGNLRASSFEAIEQGLTFQAFLDRFPHSPCRRCWAPSNLPRDLLREILEGSAPIPRAFRGEAGITESGKSR